MKNSLDRYRNCKSLIYCLMPVFVVLALTLPAYAGLIGSGDFVIMSGGRFPDVAYGSQSHKYLVASSHPLVCQLVNNDGTLSGSPFTVSDPGTGALFPSVAYNSTNNEFLVAWDTWDRDGCIYGQRVNADTGAKIGGNLPIGSVAGGARSSVAWSSASNCYYVVYTNFGGSHGQRISNTGAKLGSETNLSYPIGGSWYPAVSYGSSGNQFLVVWDGNYGICAVRVDAATGNVLGSILSVANGDRPCVAYDTINNRWLVQYCQTVAGDPNGRDQFGRLINSDGTFAGAVFPIFHTAAYETESNFGGDICFIPGKGGRFYSSVPSVTDMFCNMSGQELTTSGAPIGGQISLAVNHGGGNNNAADTDLNRYMAVYEDPSFSLCTLGRIYSAGDPPSPVTGLWAMSAFKQNTLSWQNPSDSDFAGTVIRCKTTNYPSSPGDGNQVCTRSTPPGGTDSFAHTGLANYATYYYCAWAYDTNGDYALVAQESSMPTGLPDAPTVTTPANGSIVVLNTEAPIGATLIAWAGNPQTAYQVRLTQDNDPNTTTNGWDSGQVASASTSANSPVLQDGSAYYVFVRIRNPHGWSPWSANGYKFTAKLSGSESFVYHADALPASAGWQVYDTGSYQNGGSITSQIIADGGSNVWSLNDASTSNRCKVQHSVGNVSFDTGVSLAARVAVPVVSGTQGYNLGISNGNVGGMFLRLSSDQVSLVDLNGSLKGSLPFDATPYHTYYLTVKNATLGNNSTATWRAYVDGFQVIAWTGAGLENGFDGFMAGDSATTGTGTWKYDWIGCRCDGEFTPATWAPVGSHDHYAPKPVSGFAAVTATGQVTLSWTNPSEPWFTGTMIRCSTTGYPSGATDGTLVVDKTAAPSSNDSFVHTGLLGVTYYYAAFAHNSFPDYASSSRISATPSSLPQVSNFAATAGSGGVTLSWTNPNDPWFSGTMIRYKTSGYPTSPTDGILTCDKTAAAGSNDNFVHSGLGNYTYYYAAFAHDATPVYAAATLASATPGCVAVWLNENFDSYANGNLGGQGGWSITGGASAQVGAYGEAAKGTLLDTVASGGLAIANQLDFEPRSGGYHYFSLSVSQDTAGGTSGQEIAYVLQTSTGSEIGRLHIQKSRLTMEYGSGNAFLTTSAANLTWYHVRIGFNVDGRTMDLWLDDFSKYTGFTWKGTGTNLGRIVIGSDRNTNLTAQRAYIDSLAGETKPGQVAQVKDDGAWSPSLNKLHFDFDPAACAGEYRYAIGTTPGGTQTRNWTSCGQATDVIATGLSLNANQNCYISVQVGTGLSAWGASRTSDGIKLAPAVGVQAAKALPDGGANDVKALRGKLVSATIPAGTVPGGLSFYVQEPSAPYGIRVASSASVAPGDQVDVCGIMKGAGAERYLDCTGYTVMTAAGPGGPFPVAMRSASVGGVDLNASTPGIANGVGPNNVGLLVTVFGKVTQRHAIDPKYFYLDDGCGLRDGTTTDGTDNGGVRIVADPATYSEGSYVFITGIVSLFDSSGLRPQILPVSGGTLN